MRDKQFIVLGVVMVGALLGLIFTQARYFQTAFELKKAQFDYLVEESMNQTVSYIEEKAKEQEKEEIKRSKDIRHLDNNGAHKMPLGSEIKAELNSVGNMNIVIDYSVGQMEYDSKNPTTGTLFGQGGNRSLRSSIEKSRQQLKKSLGKEYDLVVVAKNHSLWTKTLEERIEGIDLNTVIANSLRNQGISAPYEYGVKENEKFTLLSTDFFQSNSDYLYKRKIYLEHVESIGTLFLVFPEQSNSLVSSIFLLLPSLIITVVLVLCFGICIFVIIKQKKLSTIKNDFINNMTHEFKTPIATISLAAQMLKDGAVSYEASSIGHIAGIIRDESKRLTIQVEKVLQTALFTESRIRMKIKNVNLNEVVENLVPKFALRVENEGGNLYCYLEADKDEILADEVHITNVISNLLDNAIKYCVKTPEISVYTRNVNNEMIVSVIDNGIGIATNEQKMIFERFYRVSTGNLHNVKGFGLGLSYVKTIVEAHGGRIEVKSVEGQGSRFDLVLPLAIKKDKIKRTLLF